MGDKATANPGVGGVAFAGKLDNEMRFHPQGGGSVGADFSSAQNTLHIPNLGSAFTAGPYAGYLQLAVVPANNGRSQIRVENNSGGQILIVLDDGTAAANAPLVGASCFPLAAGAGAAAQGGNYVDNCELGRAQIYGSSAGLQVMVREN